MLCILRHELMLLRHCHALSLSLGLSGVHVRCHSLLGEECSVGLSLSLSLSSLRIVLLLLLLLLRLLLRVRVRVVERRGSHRSRLGKRVGQGAGGEIRVVESLGGGDTLGRIKLQETFEQVDSLR